MITTQLKLSISALLKQIENILDQLSDEQFCAPITLLGGSTIGEHVRHILEFYIELNKGYENGTINYDQRIRDHQLQSLTTAAIFKLKQISNQLNQEDKNLLITANEHQSTVQIGSTYARELLYNLDHTIHHMALIKVAILLTTSISLPQDFGIAAATINYRKACAQ